MKEPAWRRLIDQIRDGLVIPVVGPQLLSIEDQETRSLQAIVAERLLKLYEQPVPPQGLPPFRELNEVVRLLGQAQVDGELVVQNPQDLYSDVHDAIRCLSNSNERPLPAALDQLAQIVDFRLFVTLTPDDLLARALRRRCAVNEIVHSPELSASEVRDLPADWRDRAGEAQLLYLFGKSCPAPLFAINDEDVLEYAHSMVTGGSHVPARFFGELQQHNLLLIGCNFSDWLSRLFLRITNKGRLSASKRKREWLIEPVDATGPLVTFLKAYSRDTEILSDVGPADFVAELHRRWCERTGAESPINGSSPEIETPAAGTVFFVSYSRGTDRSRAEKLVEALRGLGVGEREIWFDRQDIEPGASFGQRILDGIDSCRYFLPLVSEAADQRGEGFVFKEWRAANERNEGMNRSFVVPLIVDPDYEPDRYTAEPVRAWRKLDFGHAPDGIPDGRTNSTLQKLLREARRPEART
ncbi:MAG: toll/interleukin-1 receptor domain-containing protein [Burkholderiaceae bacterium]